jgi:o-succinylbenzoate synthase
VLKKIDDLLSKDFKTIKIKIGGNSFNDDIELINTITNRIDDSIKIRLDINGNWDYEKAEYAVNALDNTKIELIEQPVNDINELVMLSDFSPIPIAVDETIKNCNDARNIIEKSNIQTIILKPSILGGIIETITFIKSAEKLGKKIIISSAFESAVGRSALMLLASMVNGNHAHGLNTASYLAEDLASDEYPVSDGTIFFNHKKYPPEFNGLNL